MIFELSGMICDEFGSRMRPRGGPNGSWIEDKTHPGGGLNLEAIYRPIRGRGGILYKISNVTVLEQYFLVF